MKQNMNQWIYDISNSFERESMPIIACPGSEMIGCEIIDLVTKGKAQYEAMHALSSWSPSIAAMTIMDLSVEAEAFGSKVEYYKDDTPTISSRLVSDLDSVKELKIPKIGEGRTGEYIKAVELTSKNIKDRPVFGGMIGPYSLAGRLFDITEIMIEAMLEPETVHILLEKSTSFLIEFAKAFKQAGANGVIMAEPAAGLLSPEQCHEFSSVYVKKIVDAVQDDRFMVILHNCGNVEKLVPTMLSTGAMGYHFGNSADMKTIMPQIPWGKLAFGNIDPAGILKNGTKEMVREKTLQLLNETAIYKNFVLSTGCDVPPGTPLQNVQEFYDTLDEFNKTIIRIETA